MDARHWAELQAFETIARLKSFRRAAIELGVTPSALSHTLRGLEEHMGVRLLNRTTRSVSPTEAGERLLQRLTPALKNIREAVDDVNAFRESPVGTLRINAPRAALRLMLSQWVTQFLLLHPGMRVELVGDDALIDIVAQGFDAGVRFGDALQQDMIAVPLGGLQRFVVVASPDYLARHGIPQTPHDLVNHACMRVRFPSGRVFAWEFQRGGDTMAVDVDGPLTTDDFDAMLDAACQGLCLSYLYEPWVREALTQGKLKAVLQDWCPEVSGFYLYYPSRQHMSAGLRAFVDFVQRQRTV